MSVFQRADGTWGTSTNPTAIFLSADYAAAAEYPDPNYNQSQDVAKSGSTLKDLSNLNFSQAYTDFTAGWLPTDAGVQAQQDWASTQPWYVPPDPTAVDNLSSLAAQAAADAQSFAQGIADTGSAVANFPWGLIIGGVAAIILLPPLLRMVSDG